MDVRTVDLLDALNHPGGSFLFELLERDATEAELVASVAGATQATGNRRLFELERLGLVTRESGRAQAPGRRWSLRHEREVDALLQAALGLSRVVAQREDRERRAAQRRLKRARARRLGIRPVADSDGQDN